MLITTDSLFTTLVTPLATSADTLKDDFKNARLTKELWEVKKGDWKIEDGWWESNSPAVGQGSFVLFSDIETHDGLSMKVKCRDKGGAWSNCYTIFAYVDDDEVYYAGARSGAVAIGLLKRVHWLEVNKTLVRLPTDGSRPEV